MAQRRRSDWHLKSLSHLFRDVHSLHVLLDFNDTAAVTRLDQRTDQRVGRCLRFLGDLRVGRIDVDIRPAERRTRTVAFDTQARHTQPVRTFFALQNLSEPAGHGNLFHRLDYPQMFRAELHQILD